MAKRNRREEMSRLLARREREELTYAELSERCGIPAATLWWWNAKLRRESGPGFTELAVVDEEAPAGSGIRIIAGGLVVEVGDDFNAELLARVVDVLRLRC